MSTLRPLSVGSLLLCLVSEAVGQNPVVVRSTGPGAWGAQLRVVEEIRIGQVEGDDAYTFGPYIGHLAAAQDGSIFVGEGRPVLLRIYDANGRFVRKVGGDGEAPGEYRSIDGLKTLPDGSIALRDGRLGRVTVYDSKGEFRRSFHLPTGLFTADVFRYDRDGNFYIKAQARQPDHGSFGLDRRMVWIKVNAAGVFVDSLPIPQGPTPAVQTYGGPNDTRLDPLLAALSPLGYFVTGNPMRYSFDLHRVGAPVRVEREHKPVPLARGEKAEWEAWADHLSKEPTSSTVRIVDGKRQEIAGPTAKYVAPSNKPAYRALQVDDEGRIWVERYVEARQTVEPPRPPNSQMVTQRPIPPRSWREPRTFDVFEPTGRFLGTVVYPTGTSIYVQRGRQLWGVSRGEYDVLYIVRYRVEPVTSER